MTEWLVRRFAKDSGNTGDAAVRTAYGQFAGIVCIVCNIALCIAKGAIGALAGSVSIVADAVNNLSDAASNIVSLLGFKLASRPADPEHPYGHGRYEYLAGLVVAALVLAIGINLVGSSVERILDPAPVEFSGALVAVLRARHRRETVDGRVEPHPREAHRVRDAPGDRRGLQERRHLDRRRPRLGRRLTGDGNPARRRGGRGGGRLHRLERHRPGARHGKPPARAGALPELVEHIRTKIMGYPGVLGTHDLMVHDYGPGRQFASAHVEMAAEADPIESHDLIDNIEQDFKNDDRLIVTLHYDPIVTDDPAVVDMRGWIDRAVKIIDPRITIHDLRCVPGPTHTNVIFDCVRPADLPMGADELRRRVSRIVRDRYPRTIPKITVDESYVSSEQ